jgi:hypothetical protein
MIEVTVMISTPDGILLESVIVQYDKLELYNMPTSELNLAKHIVDTLEMKYETRSA